jgi:hypothetical protein
MCRRRPQHFPGQTPSFEQRVLVKVSLTTVLPSIYLWFYSPSGPRSLFQFLNPYTVGRTPWMGISPSQGRYLHTEEYKHRINAHRHSCLEWESKPRSQCSSGWRRLMPYTAQPRVRQSAGCLTKKFSQLLRIIFPFSVKN